MNVTTREDQTNHPKRPPFRRRWFRRAYLLPAEHGSWSWLLVPFLVGAVIAGHGSPATLLILGGGLSVFLLRQPATAWLRIRQGRGRPTDEPVAFAWTAIFALLALLSSIALLFMQRQALFWLFPPVAALLMIYLALAQINRAQVRTLWMELAGAAGLAVMAPAAYVAGTGALNTTAWLLWLLMAMQNVLGVLYVRIRISDTHRRAEPRLPVLAGHLLGTIVIATALLLTEMPMLALVPFLFFLLRAFWTAMHVRPIPDIRRFGFTEVFVELAAGVWLVISFLLP